MAGKLTIFESHSSQDIFKLCAYTLNSSKIDVITFWTSIFKNEIIPRPYCWDGSLAAFEASLLFLTDSFVDAEWFSRFVDISILAVECYGPCILEKNENLVLDWLRHYFFLKHTECLLLNDFSANSSSQLETMEKYIDTIIFRMDWKKLAIQDILFQSSHTCLGTAWQNILNGSQIDLLPFSWLLRRIVSSQDCGTLIEPLVSLARKQLNGNVKR